MRYPLVIALCIAVIGAIVCAGCVNPLTRIPASDVTATELRVQYDYPVYARYGTGDCIFQGEIPPRKVIRFASTCSGLMNYAYFNKTLDDTHPEPLQVDLVRDEKIIKSYSTENSSISFRNIDDFLARSAGNPGIVQAMPITINIVTNGTWDGWTDDKYGGQYEKGIGPARLTLNQPVLPVDVCIRNSRGSPPASLAIELYQGEKRLLTSNTTDLMGRSCVTYS